jgi:hypothetical protein
MQKVLDSDSTYMASGLFSSVIRFITINDYANYAWPANQTNKRGSIVYGKLISKTSNHLDLVCILLS